MTDRCTPDSGFNSDRPSPNISPIDGSQKKYFLNVEDESLDVVDTIKELQPLWLKPCTICNHVFHSNADFIAHGRIHFAEQQHSILNTAAAATTPPPTPTYSYAYQYPPPPYLYYPPAPPPQATDLWALNQYYPPQNPQYPPVPQQTYNNPLPPTQQYQGDFQFKLKDCPKNCNCQKCGKVISKKIVLDKIPTVKKSVKRKRAAEKEELDEKTLRKLANLEWEKQHGHWCRICNKRYDTQDKLVDHLSYDDQHAINASSKKQK